MPPKEHMWVRVREGDPPPPGYQYVERVQCPCGGSHLPCGTPEGAQSYRQHIRTQRHMRWLLNDMGGGGVQQQQQQHQR